MRRQTIAWFTLTVNRGRPLVLPWQPLVIAVGRLNIVCHFNREDTLTRRCIHTCLLLTYVRTCLLTFINLFRTCCGLSLTSAYLLINTGLDLSKILEGQTQVFLGGGERMWSKVKNAWAFLKYGR